MDTTSERRATGINPRPYAIITLCLALLSIAAADTRRLVAQVPSLINARDLYRTGEYLECVERCDEAIAAGTYNPQWWRLKTEAALAVGDYPTAWEAYQQGFTKFSFSIELLAVGRDVVRFLGEAEEVAELAALFDRKIKESEWRYSDAGDLVLRGQRQLELGADARTILEDYYDRATRQSSRNVAAWIATGELGLSKHDYALAADAFRKAQEITDDEPAVLLGLARALESSDEEAAQAALDRTLEINARYVPALHFVIDHHIDAERYDLARQVIDEVLSINPEDATAWAYLAVLALLENEPDRADWCHQLARGWWSDNPAVDHLIGRKLSEKYRFAEGADYQRRALQVDADYLPAQFQLSQDLLRLGKEEQGWQLAEKVFARDPYNVVANNLLKLKDHVADYATLQSEHFILRMDARESEIFGQRALALLEQAYELLTVRYDSRPSQRVVVEMFARQEDFAIRTFGLPGGAGYLGVCFGPVITANSPSALDTPSSWESVLWHEFCHVVTLTKTRNRMPRWLSEGISVYEERRKDASWGQQWTPLFREMTLGDDFVPLSQLSSAFLNARSGAHLNYAYFESSMAVEFMVERYGLEQLEEVLDDLGQGEFVNASLSRRMAPIERLDQEFAAFMDERANGLGNNVDWEPAELSERTALSELEQAVAQRPRNLALRKVLVRALLKEESWEAAEQQAVAVLELYDRDVESYAQLAQIYVRTDRQDELIETLNRIVQIDSDATDVFLQLAKLEALRENWDDCLVAIHRYLAVQPLLPDPYRLQAQAAKALDDPGAAIEAYRALATLDPSDPAEIRFQLAELLVRQGKLEEARLEYLRAAEEAPRYRAALQGLLKVSKALQQQAGQQESAPPEAGQPQAAREEAAREEAAREEAAREEAGQEEACQDQRGQEKAAAGPQETVLETTDGR